MEPGEFLRAPLGALRTPVCRIGLSASYLPGRETVYRALEEGLNYFFFSGVDYQFRRRGVSAAKILHVTLSGVAGATPLRVAGATM
jgi:hypothetical protein